MQGGGLRVEAKSTLSSRDGTRTRTSHSGLRILSPVRLPIPPPGRVEKQVFEFSKELVRFARSEIVFSKAAGGKSSVAYSSQFEYCEIIIRCDRSIETMERSFLIGEFRIGRQCKMKL